MSLDLTLLMLLHLLLFAYWLGGDIGVFYSSFVLTNPEQSQEARLAAAKILFAVDLVPRICLIFTLPSGLALAVAAGWLTISSLWIFAVFIAAFFWVVAIVYIHLNHGDKTLSRIDLALRYLVLIALAIAGSLGFIGTLEMPLFVALKLLALGFALLLGLIIRHMLEPFTAAFADLAKEGPSIRVDETIRSSLGRARVPVILIWITLIVAALLGIATPL